VAVETVGNWYRIVDEIEEAGMAPQLVHARKAKLMLSMVNKTDKLDARREGLTDCSALGPCPRCGYRHRSYGISGSCLVPGWASARAALD
jgi:hypothetical protein